MTERSTTITPELLRSMVRDTTLVRLSDRGALIVWAVVAVLIVLGLAFAATPSERENAAMPLVGGILFTVFFPPLILGTTRRALTAALPIGRAVTIEVRDRTLYVETARGSSDAQYAAYRAVVERGSVVLLRLRGSQIASTFPREVLDDEDLARLRQQVASAVSAP